jgi:lipopolysaccharide export system permease protein
MARATGLRHLGLEEPTVNRSTTLIFRHVIPMVLLAWLVLIAVTALLTVKDELAKLGGGYELSNLITYLALTTPRRAYEYFVYAAVFGTVIALGQLAQNSELVALQSLGLSKRSIVMRALFALGLLTLLVMGLAESWGSTGDRKAQQVLAQARKQTMNFSTGNSLWIKDGEVFINAKTAVPNPDGIGIELWGVRILDFDQGIDLKRIVSAKTASYVKQQGWQLHEVIDQQIQLDSATVVRQDTMLWPSGLEPGQISARALKPSQQSILELSRNVAYARANKLDELPFSSAMWARICFPLAVLSLALAAASFAFGSLRTGGLGRSIFLGMLIAVVFFVLQRIGANLFQTFHWPMLLANSLPPLMIASWGLWRLTRA